MSKPWRLALLAAAALVLVAGCGDGDEDAVEEAPAPVEEETPEPVEEEAPAPVEEETPEPVEEETPEPAEPVDEFDADAAAAEVATNVTLFFDNLALLGAAEIWGALLAMVPDEPEFDADAAAAEVATNVTLFFDNLALLGAAEGAEQERLIAEMTSVLEGGNEDSGAGMLAVAGLAPGLSVEMTDVAVVDEQSATFIFSLLISGTPTQVADANGRAVNEDGTWKLAAEIWGALLAMVPDEPEFDADAAAAEVATNVTLFFDNLALLGAAEGAEQERLIAEMTSVLEGGNEDSGAGMLAVAGLAPGLSVEMTDVAVVDEQSATFVFSLLISGTPTQVADANGSAVNEDGTWKLAAEIWGALLGMVPDDPENN